MKIHFPEVIIFDGVTGNVKGGERIERNLKLTTLGIIRNLVFSKAPLGESIAGAVELGWDPAALRQISRFPPNRYKTLVGWENPMPFAGPHRRCCREGLEPDAPRRAHTHMFIKSFPTKALGISGDLQSHVAIPNDDPQVQLELYRQGCGGSGHKE